MAKFAVGEKCLFIGPVNNPFWDNISLPVETVIISTDLNALERESTTPEPYAYKVNGLSPSGYAYVRESELRKLPPDDHAADTTEEPGLTRLKKLLEQDTVPHKQPKREKA